MIGFWKIITYDIYYIETAIKVIEVTDHNSPIFEVFLKVPKYHKPNAKSLKVVVIAKYLSGTNIKGMVCLIVNPQSKGKIKINEEIDGRIEFVIDLTDKKMKDEIEFVAKVTDYWSETSIKTKHEKSSKFEHDYEFKITGDGKIKPGLNYARVIKVTRADGQPIEDGKHKIILICYTQHEVKSEINVFTSTSSGILINGEFKFWLQTPQSDVNSKLNNIYTHGTYCNVMFHDLFYKLDDKPIAPTEESPSNSYLKVRLGTVGKIYIGTSFDIRVNSTQPMTQLMYMIFGNGYLVFSKKFILKEPHTEHQVEVKATYTMTSIAKIIVYYIRGSEFVGDSVDFKVEDFIRTPIRIDTSSKLQKPGGSMDITVTTSAYTP